MVKARNMRSMNVVTTWRIAIWIYECVLSCVSTVEQLFCCRSYFLMDFLSCLLMIDCKLSLRFFFHFFIFTQQVERNDVLRRDRRARRSENVRSLLYSLILSLFCIRPFLFSLPFSCGGDESLVSSNELGSWLKSKLFWEEQEEEKWPFHRAEHMLNGWDKEEEGVRKDIRLKKNVHFLNKNHGILNMFDFCNRIWIYN
jgi:hypothetical protein